MGMSTSVIYTSTLLDGTNKVGNLKLNSQGYYEDVVLGAFNTYNQHGDFYPYSCVKTAMDSDVEFRRRIQNKALRGEVGHPIPPPELLYKNLSKEEFKRCKEMWFARVLEIREINTCVQFMEINFSHNTMTDANGRPLVVVLAKIRPSGACERFLERQLQNKNENVCFSIRCFAMDKILNNGEKYKEIKKMVTWDYVNEPGIAIANKFASPSLESLNSNVFTLDQLNDFGDSNIITDLGMSASFENSKENHKEVAKQLIGFIKEVQEPIKSYVPRTFSPMRGWAP